MVRIDVSGGVVTFTVLGLHKLWSLRSRISIPAADIVDIAPGEPAVRGEWPGWRLPGTSVPGVITAGSYLKSGAWSFWDVVRPAKAIAVTTKNQRFRRVIVEVADPTEEILRLQRAVAAAAPPSNNKLQLTKPAQAMELRS
jgi:hypothetical protein